MGREDLGSDPLHSHELAEVLQFSKVLALSFAHRRCFLGHNSIRVLAVAAVERCKG